MIDPDNLGLHDEAVPLANRQAWQQWLAAQKQGRAGITPRQLRRVLGITATITTVLTVIIYLWR